MSAFDLTNQSMQCTRPETDYAIPRMKLRDETFVFIDGKWVNETYCQPPFASHWKLFGKKAQNEWSIWEENRALWEENQVLRIENRMLWEENQALQCLQSQNKTVQVIYNDATQQSLQKDRLFPFFQERNLGFQVSLSNKALQGVREKNRVLEVFQQENKTLPSIWKDQKVVVVHEESKDASSVQKDAEATTAVEEGNLSPVPQQEHEAKAESITPTQSESKAALSTEDDCEILQALHNLHQILQVFLRENRLPGDRERPHPPHDEGRFYQEEYKKLKLQLNAVKNTVSDITAQMEMLEKELIAFTFPMYEEAGQKLANKYQLRDM
ncbi:protein chibby homolog 2 [Oxyura jamaicensis]|uniref:protein chibby homolog 2 n=1 Tax=Oxyura jamaicensis TaxID=8884 RepID=UPI0015A5E9F8|nr:protein chibby homolog 2 [Oxyura jamaicensis]XP_035169206.1 protein chibby homolog 2 [Oxyura jamaicensis]